MNPQTRKKLEVVSVATLCTALYKRGLRNQTVQDVRPISAKKVNMVGPAYTLRYIPAREDLKHFSAIQRPFASAACCCRRMPSRRCLSDG